MALYQSELIDRSLFHELMQIGRHRNLAFFGRVPSVDKTIIDQTRAALARIRRSRHRAPYHNDLLRIDSLDRD